MRQAVEWRQGAASADVIEHRRLSDGTRRLEAVADQHVIAAAAAEIHCNQPNTIYLSTYKAI